MLHSYEQCSIKLKLLDLLKSSVIAQYLDKRLLEFHKSLIYNKANFKIALLLHNKKESHETGNCRLPC